MRERDLLRKLRDLGVLVKELHPGADGLLMRARLQEFRADPTARAQLREFARQWADLKTRELIDLVDGHHLKERIAAFWPLRAVIGGNGKPCRLEIRRGA